MNALGIAIVFCAIQVTVFSLMAGAVYLAANRQGPIYGARAAFTALLGVALLTAVFWSPWPNWMNPTGPKVDARVEAEVTNFFRGRQAGSPAAGQTGSREASQEARLQQAAAPTWAQLFRDAWKDLQQEPESDNAVGQSFGHWNWLDLTASAFIIAAAIGLVRLIGGLLGAMVLRRRCMPLNEAVLNERVELLRAELGCTRRVAIGECRHLATAATLGWRRPLVLLPTNWRSWNDRELRAVLAHEIAHIRRADFAMHALAQLGVALHFYHPVVQWLARRLRLEQELAADAAAAGVVGGRQSYVNVLAGLALAQPAVCPAWPIHAFLPTRRTFFRRLEMLRDQKATEQAVSTAARVRKAAIAASTMIVLCVAGLAAVGLRAPTIARAQDAPSAANEPEPPAANLKDSVRFDFSYVPENFFALVAVRPAELAADRRLQPLATLLEESTRPAIPSVLVDQWTLTFVAPESNAQRVEPGTGGEQIVVHTTEPVDFSTYLKPSYPSLSTARHEGRELFVISPSPSAMSFFTPDRQTLIGRVRAGLLQLLSNEDAAQPPAGAERWQTDAEGPFLFVAQSATIGPKLMRELDAGSPLVLSLTPLIHSAETLVLSAEADDELQIQGRFVCKSPEDAKRVAESLDALAVLTRNVVDAQRQRLSQAAGTLPAHKQWLDLVQKLLDRRNITIDGDNVRMETSLGDTETAVRMVVETLAPATIAAREAAQRTQSLNNLKQIALAVHNYYAVHKHLPPAVLYGPDGKTPHSWRVALLPYLEEQAIYEQYRFDQPWDAEANRKVLAQMPDIYRHPNDIAGSTHASYFALTGPDTAFDGKEGTTFQEIIDGTSNTILAVSAKRDIPWTKPEDIPYAAEQPLPELGGWIENVFDFAMCDGSAQSVSRDSVEEKTLRAMITKAGRETFERP